MAVQKQLSAPRRRRASEVAGNTMAECTAVCCCLPCAVLDVVALAVFKVPAGLWKKAMNSKRKRRLLKQQQKKKLKKNNEVAMLEPKPEPSGLDTVVVGPTLEEHLAKETPEVDKLEEEMWAQFSATGFWRSVSRRYELEVEMQARKTDR